MPSAPEQWALESDLALCGSVPPPHYASSLDAETHLNTFDVSASGLAVLLSDCGRLYLLQLGTSSPQGSRAAPDAPDDRAQRPERVRLIHLELDPPLPKDHVRAVQSVRLNASNTRVLLVAAKWVRTVKIPSEAADAMYPSPSASASAATSTAASTSTRRLFSAGQAQLLLSSAAKHANVQRFLVRLDDDSSEVVTLDTSAIAPDDLADEIRRRTRTARTYPQSQSQPRGRVAVISREVYCASIQQVGYFSVVRAARWHPLSDAHVVVLSDAEDLALFDLQHDATQPEQHHALRFPAPSQSPKHRNPAGVVSTSFCFGSAMQLWDVFTCYVLRSDGSIYALCPLVPYEAQVRASVVATLKHEVDARLTLIKKSAEREAEAAEENKLRDGYDPRKASKTLAAAMAELKSQKYWLDEAWAPAPPAGFASVEQRDGSPEFYRYVKPHISGISPETWPLELQGPIEVSPESTLERKSKNTHGAPAVSIVAMRPSPSAGDNHRPVLCPFLLRSYASGHVELMLLDVPTHPRWKSNPSAPPVGSKLRALLLECLDLGVDISGGLGVLERDFNDSRLVYYLHSTGVHVLNVGWVWAMAAGKPLSATPSTSVRQVFGVSPGTASQPETNCSVIGARVIKNVNFGHLLLLRLASGSFQIVNVSAASNDVLKGMISGAAQLEDEESAVRTLPGALRSKSTALTTTSDANPNGITPFSTLVEKHLETLSTRGTRVSGRTALADIDDDVLAFFINRIKILHEDVKYVDGMEHLLQDRVDLHAEWLKTQQEKAKAITTSVQDARQTLEALQTKVQRAVDIQQNLRKRAAAVLQAIKENLPQLSKAEREYKGDLEQLTVDVRRLKLRVMPLTMSGQRLVEQMENQALARTVGISSGYPEVLSETKKKMCYDVLRAETQLIDDTKRMVEELTMGLDRLRT